MREAAATDRSSVDDDARSIIKGLIGNARAAMETFENAEQETVDAAVTALAWSIYEPSRARELAEIAVHHTGLGNVESKIIKNTRKTSYFQTIFIPKTSY